MRYRRLGQLLVGILSALVVAAAHLAPPDWLPRDALRGIADWIDKPVHALLFLFLCAALYWSFGRTPRGLRWSLGLSVAYGAALEALQPVLAARDASGADLLADVIGALLFVACVKVRA